MWESIKSKVKAALRWVYEWVTVLTASLVGLPSLVLELLSSLDGINISPLIGSDKALKIVTAVAIVKAVLALIENKMKPSA